MTPCEDFVRCPTPSGEPKILPCPQPSTTNQTVYSSPHSLRGYYLPALPPDRRGHPTSNRFRPLFCVALTSVGPDRILARLSILCVSTYLAWSTLPGTCVLQSDT